VWSTYDRLLRATVAEADRPASPARERRFADLYHSISQGTLRADDTAVLHLIGEIESWETFDAALAMLAAAADFDVENPKAVKASEFAMDVDADSVRFRLLVPKPSEVLVVLSRAPRGAGEK
jgi:hypothetical protein